MNSRLGFRMLRVGERAPSPSMRLRHSFRRFQQTSSSAASDRQARFGRLWNSPVGPKTVHFWAPVMKWALVLTGISDFARPAEKLSATQNGALTATGAIWTRWCFIIRPKNHLLAAVNFFLFCVGSIQLARIYQYRRSTGSKPLAEEIKDAAAESVETVKKAVKA